MGQWQKILWRKETWWSVLTLIMEVGAAAGVKIPNQNLKIVWISTKIFQKSQSKNLQFLFLTQEGGSRGRQQLLNWGKFALTCYSHNNACPSSGSWLLQENYLEETSGMSATLAYYVYRLSIGVSGSCDGNVPDPEVLYVVANEEDGTGIAWWVGALFAMQSQQFVAV